MSFINNIDYCIFCGTQKTWNSNFRITDNDDMLIFKCTVCRSCRKKYSIEQLIQRYDQLADAEIQAQKSEDTSKHG